MKKRFISTRKAEKRHQEGSHLIAPAIKLSGGSSYTFGQVFLLLTLPIVERWTPKILLMSACVTDLGNWRIWSTCPLVNLALGPRCPNLFGLLIFLYAIRLLYPSFLQRILQNFLVFTKQDLTENLFLQVGQES